LVRLVAFSVPLYIFNHRSPSLSSSSNSVTGHHVGLLDSNCTHTHTHTHTYIYMYIYIYIYIYIYCSRYLQESYNCKLKVRNIFYIST
jgi:hypothetical protein